MALGVSYPRNCTMKHYQHLTKEERLFNNKVFKSNLPEHPKVPSYESMSKSEQKNDDS